MFCLVLAGAVRKGRLLGILTKPLVPTEPGLSCRSSEDKHETPRFVGGPHLGGRDLG